MLLWLQSATYWVQFTWTVVNVLAVPLVAMEGYYSKFIIFTGATPPQRCKYGCDRYISKNTYTKRNVTSDCTAPWLKGLCWKSISVNTYIRLFNRFILFFRSIIRAKLLKEECNCFCVSWLLLERYFWELVFLTSHVSAKTSVSFVVIRQSFSALYLNNNVPSCPLLRF